MLTITERAKVELEELLLVNNAPPGQGVKLVPGGPSGVGMSIETPSEGDEVIKSEEGPLLIIDGRIAAGLAGGRIDYDDVTSQFTLLPPSELRRAS